MDIVLIKKVLREDYDFIQVHEDSQLMGPLILSAAKDKGIKTILYQGMYKNFSGLGRIYQFIFDFFFKEKIKNNIDFIFAKTNEAKDYLNKKGYVNVEVRPIGLDFVKEQDSYSDFETIVRLKNKFQHLALYVGILEKRRDIIFLLEVLKELLALNNSLYLGFIIVGKGADLFKVKERIKDLELTDNVLIIDSVPNNEIGDIYKSCDLFLLPTHYEIYGMVVMEALYYGIPVISSRTAGPLDILKDLYLGQTIEMNKEIWMNTITKYLDSFKNKGEYKTKRKDFIISNYSWDNLAYNYLKEIKQIVG